MSQLGNFLPWLIFWWFHCDTECVLLSMSCQQMLLQFTCHMTNFAPYYQMFLFLKNFCWGGQSWHTVLSHSLEKSYKQVLFLFVLVSKILSNHPQLTIGKASQTLCFYKKGCVLFQRKDFCNCKKIATKQFHKIWKMFGSSCLVSCKKKDN